MTLIDDDDDMTDRPPHITGFIELIPAPTYTPTMTPTRLPPRHDAKSRSRSRSRVRETISKKVERSWLQGKITYL